MSIFLRQLFLGVLREFTAIRSARGTGGWLVGNSWLRFTHSSLALDPAYRGLCVAALPGLIGVVLVKPGVPALATLALREPGLVVRIPALTNLPGVLPIVARTVVFARWALAVHAVGGTRIAAWCRAP